MDVAVSAYVHTYTYTYNSETWSRAAKYNLAACRLLQTHIIGNEYIALCIKPQRRDVAILSALSVCGPSERDGRKRGIPNY